MSSTESTVLGPAPKPKLYSVVAIDIATVVGSWLAGAVLISRNYSRLGDRDAARNAILFGIAATVALAVVILSIVVPENAERGVRYVSEGVQVGMIHLLASRFQGAALKSHEAAGGEFYSRWRAFGIGILVLPAVIALFVALVLLFPNLPALRE
jgi:hypothetical protein